MDDLTRRAVACARWKWVSGMADTHGCRFVSFDKGATWVWVGPEGVEVSSFSRRTYSARARRVATAHAQGVRLPDLSDPATLGCLRALVAEVWREHGLLVWTEADNDDDDGVVRWSLGWVRLRATGAWLDIRGASEAEVLVTALERMS